MPENEIKEIARVAGEQAKERFGQMVEQGADPWAVREQILSERSRATLAADLAAAREAIAALRFPAVHERLGVSLPK